MHKFFYSKSNNTSQAQQSDNAIILNGNSVKFYKNRVNIKALPIPNIGNMPFAYMPTALNMLNSLPDVLKSKYLQFYNQKGIYNNNIIPAGTSVNNNAFAYMKASFSYMNGNQWNWPI